MYDPRADEVWEISKECWSEHAFQREIARKALRHNLKLAVGNLETLNKREAELAVAANDLDCGLVVSGERGRVNGYGASSGTVSSGGTSSGVLSSGATSSSGTVSSSRGTTGAGSGESGSTAGSSSGSGGETSSSGYYSASDSAQHLFTNALDLSDDLCRKVDEAVETATGVLLHSVPWNAGEILELPAGPSGALALCPHHPATSSAHETPLEALQTLRTRFRARALREYASLCITVFVEAELPRFLAFEFIWSVQLRARQIDLVLECVQAAQSVDNPSIVKQMIM